MIDRRVFIQRTFLVATTPVVVAFLPLADAVSPDRLALAGLVLYTFALLAVMNAAVADGLVTPSLLRQIVASAGSPPVIDGWRMMSRYNFYVNQAYAQVFVNAWVTR